jgi:serine/threonine kinase 16
LSLQFLISVKILKVLGEGGFSFVYLCQDEASGVSLAFKPSLRFPVVVLTIVLQREFALKKIRCPTGSEDVRQAMREVEAYRRFKCVDSCIPHVPPAGLIRIWIII